MQLGEERLMSSASVEMRKEEDLDLVRLRAAIKKMSPGSKWRENVAPPNKCCTGAAGVSTE